MFWSAINIYSRCYLAITKDQRLACSHSQAIQWFWSRGIFGTLSRLESAPKPKSAYGTGLVRLGSEPASTMAPSQFRVVVAATLETPHPFLQQGIPHPNIAITSRPWLWQDDHKMAQHGPQSALIAKMDGAMRAGMRWHKNCRVEKHGGWGGCWQHILQLMTVGEVQHCPLLSVSFLTWVGDSGYLFTFNEDTTIITSFPFRLRQGIEPPPPCCFALTMRDMLQPSYPMFAIHVWWNWMLLLCRRWGCRTYSYLNSHLMVVPPLCEHPPVLSYSIWRQVSLILPTMAHLFKITHEVTPISLRVPRRV